MRDERGKMLARVWIVPLVCGLAMLTPTRACAGELRIALLANTDVLGDTILLANLLPASAPRTLRAEAEEISLGTSPQSGSARQFTQAALTEVLSASGLSAHDFTIPDTVTVRREGRLISRGEVLAAVEVALEKNPQPGISAQELKDITVETAVRVPQGDAGLVVNKMTFDATMGCIRFRLRARRAPGVLPFFATLKVGSGFSETRETRHLLSIAAHVGKSEAEAEFAPVLVMTGHMARLQIRSTDMDMLLEVRPLQRGKLGEVIRVQLPGTGRMLQARVAGKDYLDATL